MKRSKYSFHDFSAKHTPSATLRNDVCSCLDPPSVESLIKSIEGPPIYDFKTNLCCVQKHAVKYAGLPGCPIFALYFRTTMFWEMVSIGNNSLLMFPVDN